MASAADLVVTFIDANDVAHVYQAARDVEVTSTRETSSTPGIVSSVGAEHPDAFSVLLQVSDNLRDLPQVSPLGEVTTDRGASEQYGVLKSLEGRAVKIYSRATLAGREPLGTVGSGRKSPVPIFVIDMVKAIDSLATDDGWLVLVKGTQDLSGSLTGDGFAESEEGTITIPSRPTTIEEADDQELGESPVVCIPITSKKRKDTVGWFTDFKIFTTIAEAQIFDWFNGDTSGESESEEGACPAGSRIPMTKEQFDEEFRLV